MTLVGATALIGCGDDTEQESSATDEAAPTETSEAAAPEPTGEPILIGGVFGVDGPPTTPSFPEVLAAVQGAVNAVNDNGGVDGRPLELIVCADKGDANIAAACGRQFVDEGVVAVVGSAGRFSANWFPITAAAGIPFVGPPTGSPELTEPLSFPTTLGTFGNTGGAASIAVDVADVEHLGVAHVDVASAAQAVTAIDPILELHGREPSLRVPVPLNAPDMSSYAAAVTNGTDAVYMAMTTADGDKMVQAIRQSGADVTIIRSAATFPATSIDTLGPLAEGILSASQLKSASSTDDPEVAAFLDQLRSVDPNLPANDLAASAWSAVHTFADAASRAATIDPAGLVAILSSGETFEAPMTAGPVQFADPVEAVGLPRAFNTLQTYMRVEDGRLVSVNDNEFVDPYEADT